MLSHFLAGCAMVQVNNEDPATRYPQPPGEKEKRMSINRLRVALVGGLLTAGLTIGLAPVTAHAETGKIIITAHVTATAIAQANASSSASGSASAYDYVGVEIKSKAKTSSCYWTTGYNSVWSGGKIHWFWDGVKSKVCKIKAKKVGGYTVKYKKVAGGTSGRNCGNYFRPKSGPPTKAAVLDIKSKSSVEVEVSAWAKTDVSAKVAVTISYTYNGVTKTEVKMVDEAEAHGESSDSAKAKVTATKSTKVSATGAAIAKARASLKSKVEAQAKANAEASAKAQAALDVDLTIEIPIDTPPPTPAPSILEVTTVNDFRLSQEGFITASGTIASGHTATLFASAKNGGTIIANKSQKVSGEFTVNVTYKASTEVGTDQVEFTLTQDDGQKATKSTNVFNILERQTTP